MQYLRLRYVIGKCRVFSLKKALRTTDEALDILIVAYGFLLVPKAFFSLKLFSQLSIDKVKKQRKVALKYAVILMSESSA